MTADADPDRHDEFDYIIVGSGAGGAPLAARLAEAGKRVLVLEAGSSRGDSSALDPTNEVSRVPALHAVATEHESLAWRFFVDHYERRNGRLPDGIPEDPKWHNPDTASGENESHRGIFYPRATGIGGCTIHNAMITIAGPDSDWDDLADYLGDDSWRASQMRGYFERLEHNDYLRAPSLVPKSSFGRVWRYFIDSVLWLVGRNVDPTSGRHGFFGWLHTSTTDISLGLADKQLVRMLKGALWQAKLSGLERAWKLASTFLTGRVRESLDPNHRRTQAKSPEGVVLIPLAVHGAGATIHQNRAMPYVIRGRRSSPRERLLATRASHPDKLEIWTDCLVTKVLFDEAPTPRALGVEFLQGEQLYRANVRPSSKDGERKQIFVRKGGEIVLCGGTFNTPQLLMLSGVGDREHLDGLRRAVETEPSTTQITPDEFRCRVHSPGVGRNLQDRYEVSIVSRMPKNFSLLDRATFRIPLDASKPDPHLRQWRTAGTGLYTSNGGVLGIFKRSRPDLAQPDLFIFGVPLEFRGYEVGYSNNGDRHNLFSWVILKSHTQNRGGRVMLRSADPRDTPLINFHYFNTARRRDDSANDPDLAALVHGVEFVRGILRHAGPLQEVHPGYGQGNIDETKTWIRRDAWGHHACGTCRMGREGDTLAVLDSRFRVRGTAGLRVVDASIFPSIPGYFIVTNIYMASEKAADVILDDFENWQKDDPTYPNSLRQLEVEALRKRRRATLLSASDSANDQKQPGEVSGNRPADGNESNSIAEPQRMADPLDQTGAWNEDLAGLALSGGGIRSATLSLGVLQSLARAQLLRRIDFMSTVSGGGYIGSCLGRLYDRLRFTPQQDGLNVAAIQPTTLVEQELTSPDSKLIDWLRKHGNYVAPQGGGDERLNLAVFVRNLLSVHFVIGLALFSLFGIANAFRYLILDRAAALTGFVIHQGDLPITHMIQAWVGPFFSPWFILTELLVLFLVLPRIIGYWIVSQERHESYKGIPFLILILLASVLLWLGVNNGLTWEPLILGLALLSSLIQVELAWRGGRLREEALGTGGVETQRLRTRNMLTYDLGLALALTCGALGFTLIDAVGHGLHQWKIESNITYARAFAALGASIAAVVPVARLIAGLFRERTTSPPSTVARILKRSITAGLLAAILFTLPLVFYSFAAHAVYQGGKVLNIGLMVTGGAIALTILLALPPSLTFVNRSSLAQVYSARLGRAYLGASNPLRRRPEGINVTEVIPGDDVASIRNYKPHEASGPFHLINLMVNQTVDFGSRLRKRDRQGENLAVSCVGLSVGDIWHSAWANSPAALDANLTKVPAKLEPLGRATGIVHPLVDQLNRPADQAEMLSLRQWIGISGAAMDPGRGSTTNLGTALLFGLVNLRTGYWWDSGIAHADRLGRPDLSVLRRLLYLVPRFFAIQGLLLYEWLARYPGPWERYWHLSDGGYFENTGVYELVRRRVPRIILCDGTADPHYHFDSFGELVRKVCIDFAAHIEPFTDAQLKQHLPATVLPQFGNLDQLRPLQNAEMRAPALSAKHAGLFWIRYDDEPKRPSILLYLKATVTGDEPADVLQYRETNPEFPHEDTADQSFDEPQWESYRKLGEHLSGPLFAEGDWLWKIPLQQ